MTIPWIPPLQSAIRRPSHRQSLESPVQALGRVAAKKKRGENPLHEPNPLPRSSRPTADSKSLLLLGQRQGGLRRREETSGCLRPIIPEEVISPSLLRSSGQYKVRGGLAVPQVCCATHWASRAGSITRRHDWPGRRNRKGLVPTAVALIKH